ncbi:MAG: amylo-alpha-1,6-glucosidase [Actinobacteria bacterium]|nr:amylo-alpha-1,6-glucosidase [Actinomycetota bacterium]
MFEAAPHVPAENAEDLFVLKGGRLFACSGKDGLISPRRGSAQGLYRDDARYLSKLELKIGGAHPILLSSSAEPGFEGVINATNPPLRFEEERVAPQSLHLRRIRLLSRSMFEELDLVNHSQTRIHTTLSFTFGADYVDLFEVRGLEQRFTRAVLTEIVDDHALLTYRGQDDIELSTKILFDPPPAHVEANGNDVTASWNVELAPGDGCHIGLQILCAPEDTEPPKVTYESARTTAKRQLAEFNDRCARFTSDETSFDRALDLAARDIWALSTETSAGRILVAGIPWFVAPFGRDALIASYESLPLTMMPARDCLETLAAHQATADDPSRDAEPGKILHETRFGELARLKAIPHTPYYGSVDSTPLFLMLASAYHRWTNDTTTLERLKPAIDRALDWIDDFGDRDGDGYVEYERRSPAGLRNQGWKDSEDGILHRDGSAPVGPLALVEVQAYVYLAKTRIAELYEVFGEDDTSARLQEDANLLKKRFNEDFWMDDEFTMALALDGAKDQVGSVTSNPGHALFCDIVDEDRAALMVERMMRDDMFSGWGIRTLSSKTRAYNPMSYHNGSVWPHDSAIVAAGMKRYGYTAQAQKVTNALFDAAHNFEMRLPELYCGFDRQRGLPPVPYPVACKPQAWSAAAPVFLVQTMLGLTANAAKRQLQIHQPDLPTWLNSLKIERLKVGGTTMSLLFDRSGGDTACSVLESDGDVRVTIHASD